MVFVHSFGLRSVGKNLLLEHLPRSFRRPYLDLEHSPESGHVPQDRSFHGRRKLGRSLLEIVDSGVVEIFVGLRQVCIPVLKVRDLCHKLHILLMGLLQPIDDHGVGRIGASKLQIFRFETRIGGFEEHVLAQVASVPVICAVIDSTRSAIASTSESAN